MVDVDVEVDVDVDVAGRGGWVAGAALCVRAPDEHAAANSADAHITTTLRETTFGT